MSFQVVESEIDEYFAEVMKLVEQGGQLILDAIDKKKNITEKESATDLVTETDQAVEKLLFEGIR